MNNETYQGKPCKWCKETLRFRRSKNCVNCKRSHVHTSKAEHAAYMRLWYAKNLERGRAIRRKSDEKYNRTEKGIERRLRDRARWTNTLMLIYPEAMR